MRSGKANLYTPELAADRSEMFQKFLAERQTVVMDEEKRFLREELGVKAIITNLNNVASPSLQPFRDTLPLLDQHIYHDHPTFPMNNWQPPVAFNQSSDIAGYAGAMRGCMPVRIPGKPMIITEINYCYPNQFRSEMGALAGAYSALQDWDGLYRFCYEFRRANIFQPKAPGSFSSFSDPVATLTERIIWFLFVRGDVMPAECAVLLYLGFGAVRRAVPRGVLPPWTDRQDRFRFRRIESGWHRESEYRRSGVALRTSCGIPERCGPV